VLETRELREKIWRRKLFRMCTSEGIMEVFIAKGLREAVFGSAEFKGVAGSRSG
jgi:hypothetical protein